MDSGNDFNFITLKNHLDPFYYFFRINVSGTIITVICHNFTNLMEYIFINKEEITIFIDSVS